MRVLLLSLAIVVAVAIAAGAQSPNQAASTSNPADLASAPFRNPALPIEQRVDDLISRMTLEEKASQMVHTAVGIPRLGIPEYNWWNEGLHGVARAGYATVFPQAIGLAATFDPQLLHQAADVTSTEFRAKYHEELRTRGWTRHYYGLTIWSPNINIFRDPRWGRGQETYGEDPYLTATMGVAFVTGLQGNDPKYLKTLATPKHFAVHSGPEPERHQFNVNVSPHDLEDTYLPAFRATAEAGAGSVMCAYNAINGKPACAQPLLLEQYLRQAWKFNGYVVSDCAAVADISDHHHYSKTIEEGVAAALKAGTDIICGDNNSGVKYEREGLVRAAQQGLLRDEDINQAMRRLFTARMRLGMFDPPEQVPYASIPITDNDTEAHRQLALRAARESLVLLKNDGLLPLKRKYNTIAVIGPNADGLESLTGNYNGIPSQAVTLVAGIRKRFPDSKVLYAEGSGLLGPSMKPVPSDFLRPSENSTEQGLHGEYFKGIALEGAPAITRTDAQVNFDWGYPGVNADLPDHFSARWTGVFIPPATGDYLIGFTGDDGYRLWLDDKLVAEDWSTHAKSTHQQLMRLEKGHAYRIKAEYFQVRSTAEAKLLWLPPGEENEHLEAAKQADLIVVALGLTAEIEGEEMNITSEGFRGGDRTSIDLPAPQQKLLQQMQALRKPLVLVLMNGSALAVNWADANVNAILEAWYPGEEGGTALAEALAGDFSPAGRLPVTFYKSVSQLPPFDNYDMKGHTYRYFTGEPLYPFGYGLSYTSFAYSNLKFDHPQTAANQPIAVSVDVKNTGATAGDEVVQLYLMRPGVSGAPLRALQAYQRVSLKPGESRTVGLTLGDRQLSIVNDAGERQIVPGEVQVWVGGGQPVTRPGLPKTAGVKGAFHITSGATLPK